MDFNALPKDFIIKSIIRESGLKDLSEIIVKDGEVCTPFEVLSHFENCDEKTRVLVALFVGVLSLKDGKSDIVITTQKRLQQRMVGAADSDSLEELLTNENVSYFYHKYSTRKRFESLMNRLVELRLCREIFAYGRHTCINLTLSHEDFVEAIAAHFKESKKASQKRALEKQNEKRKALSAQKKKTASEVKKLTQE